MKAPHKGYYLLLLVLVFGSYSQAQIEFENKQLVSDKINKVPNPSDAALADIDGDGQTDILVNSDLEGYIAAYRNLGAGSFSSKEILIDIPNPAFIYTADLDGDGDFDILSAATNADILSWFKNDGFGNFTLADTLSDNLDKPQGAEIFDADGDGDLDIAAIAKDNHRLEYFENTASGFAPGNILSGTLFQAQAMHQEDLDLDGDADIVVATQGNNEIYLFENLGASNFSSQILLADSTSTLRDITALDIDQNGYPDLVVSDLDNHVVKTYLNSGSGLYSAGDTLATEIYNPINLELYDVDFDGDLDIISTSGAAYLLRNKGADGIGSKKLLFAFADYLIYGFQLGDLNGDPYLDAISVYNGPSEVRLHKGSTDGFPNLEILTHGLSKPWEVQSGDFDGDGDQDIVYTELSGYPLNWLENNGEGIFSVRKTIKGRSDSRGIATGDIDGDGKDEIVVSAQSYNGIVTYEHNGERIVIRDSIFQATSFPYTIQLADLSGNGWLDIIYTDFGLNSVSWFPNLGGGNYAGVQIIDDAIDNPWGFCVADFDSDTDLDIAVCSASGDQLFMYNNDGTGTFSAASNIAGGTGDYPIHVEAADMNQDAVPDLIVSYFNQDQIHWIRNTSSGFDSSFIIASGVDGTRDLVVADFDRDSYPDVVSSNFYLDNISVHKSTDGLVWNSKLVQAGIDQVRSVYADDFNDDGLIDLISAVYFDDVVQLHENISCAAAIDLESQISTASNRIDLRWSEIPNADKYLVSLTKTGSIDSTFIRSNNFILSGDLDELDTSSVYQWQIQARCSSISSLSPQSQVASFATPSPRLSEESLPQSIDLELTDRVTVFDLSGRIFLEGSSKDLNSLLQQLNALPPGTYLISNGSEKSLFHHP